MMVIIILTSQYANSIIYLVFVVECLNIIVTALSKIYKNLVMAVLETLLFIMIIVVKHNIGIIILVGVIALYGIALTII